MSPKEWLVTHLPAWLVPCNARGPKRRPNMPEKHALVNKQQELSLRLDRIEAAARLEEWRRRREQPRGG